MELLTLACEAMATRFELVLYGANRIGLRAAGEEALEEIERLHRQLSLYSNSSEIAHINACAATEAVHVDPRLLHLLQQAAELSKGTGGAFDITIAPLMHCWGFMGGTGSMPSEEEIREARSKVGMQSVKLDPENYTVRFLRPGVMLDLGAIGKGYAIERAVQLLREAGVNSAFIHGGTSTAYGLGTPPDAPAWSVAIDSPDPNWMQQRAPVTSFRTDPDRPPSAAGNLAIIPLRDQALSVSAVWGKFFQEQSQYYGHIIDPRIGHPAGKAILAAVVLPSATETDALSTALLTLGAEGQNLLMRFRPELRSLVIEPSEGESPFLIQRTGI